MWEGQRGLTRVVSSIYFQFHEIILFSNENSRKKGNVGDFKQMMFLKLFRKSAWTISDMPSWKGGCLQVFLCGWDNEKRRVIHFSKYLPRHLPWGGLNPRPREVTSDTLRKSLLIFHTVKNTGHGRGHALLGITQVHCYSVIIFATSSAMKRLVPETIGQALSENIVMCGYTLFKILTMP